MYLREACFSQVWEVQIRFLSASSVAQNGKEGTKLIKHKLQGPSEVPPKPYTYLLFYIIVLISPLPLPTILSKLQIPPDLGLPLGWSTGEDRGRRCVQRRTQGPSFAVLCE